MRTLLAAAAVFTALGFSAAHAGPVAIAPMELSKDVRKDFKREYGLKEVAGLETYLNEQLAETLAKSDGTGTAPMAATAIPVTLDVTLGDGRAIHPTMKQLRDKPGLAYLPSIGAGGAKLKARFVNARGETVREVEYDWFETDLSYVHGRPTWSDTQKVMRQFAKMVGEAYGEAEAAALKVS